MKKQQRKPEVRKRHYFYYWFFRTIFRVFLKFKYRFTGKKHKIRNEGPFLILGNHTTPLDPIFLSLSFNFPIYFVSSDQIFNLGLVSRLLKHLVNPIPKSKSLADINTIRRIKRVINEKGSVCIFAEGNVTYTGLSVSMPPAIGKLIKYLNIPVIIWQSNGLYFSHPRWSNYTKKGKTEGIIKEIIQPSTFTELSDEEVYALIKEKMMTNAYNDRIWDNYLGKKRAEGLQRLLFMCPKCGALLTTHTHDNMFVCDACGYQAQYTDDCYLMDGDGKKTLIELDSAERKHFRQYLIEHQTAVEFSDRAHLLITTPQKRFKKGEVVFKLTQEGIDISGELYQIKRDYADISAIAIQGKNKLICYFHEDETILVVFDDKTSPYKYLLMYQFFKYLTNQKENERDDYIDISKLGL